jgi:ubiquinone/menaquinone biosynthesis C-methylase UbiE
MEYFTSEELLKTNRNQVKTRLQQCVGQLVRFDFSIKTFKKCLKKYFNNNLDIKMLDVGPGNATFAEQLRELNYHNIYGVDIDNYVPDEHKHLFVKFETADLNLDKIPWQDESFDVVTAWCVLPHLENPFHCVREIARVLKKNGLFLFTVPHLTSKPSIAYFKKYGNFSMYRNKNNHIILFTQSIINKMVEKYFDILEIEYAVRPKIFSGGFRKTLRKIVYNLVKKISAKLTKSLERRWAYDTIYIIQKK